VYCPRIFSASTLPTFLVFRLTKSLVSTSFAYTFFAFWSSLLVLSFLETESEEEEEEELELERELLDSLFGVFYEDSELE
jgi:hypothetical protein